MKKQSLVWLLTIINSLGLLAQEEPFYRDVLIFLDGTVLRGTIVLERNDNGEIEFTPIGRDYSVSVSPLKLDKRYRETIYVEEIPIDKSVPVKKKDEPETEVSTIKPRPNSGRILPIDSAAAARRRHYVGVSLTSLIPSGNFGSAIFDKQFNGRDFSNELAMANSGYAIGLDATLMFTPKSAWGVAASFQTQFNSINSSMSSGLAYRYGQGSYVSASGYRNTFLVGGLAISTALGPKMKSFWDARFMFGYGILGIEQGIIANFANGTKSQIFYNAKPGGAFVMDMGFHFNIARDLGLALRMGYSKTAYWNVNVESYGGYRATQFSQNQPSTISANIEQFTMGIGFIYAYKLKKR